MHAFVKGMKLIFWETSRTVCSNSTWRRAIDTNFLLVLSRVCPNVAVSTVCVDINVHICIIIRCPRKKADDRKTPVRRGRDTQSELHVGFIMASNRAYLDP